MKDVHYKIPVLQDLLNVYPAWSKVRKDHQSLGAQILNSLGLAFEDLRWQLNRELANNWLQQYDCLALDSISEVDIADFDLTYVSDHPGEMVLQAPTCSGQQNGTWYNVELADPNSLEALYYDFIPTRVSLYQATNSGNYVVVDSNIFTISSGIAATNSWESLDHTLPFANRLYVTIENGQLFYTKTDQIQCRVTITGEDRNEVSISEEIPFAFNDTRRTTRVFSKVDSISITGLKITDMDLESSSPATIRVVSAQFSDDDRPLTDDNTILYSDQRQKGIQKWDISVTSSGTVLQDQRFSVFDPTILQAGYGDLTTERETLLRDTTGSGIIVSDIAMQRGRYWFWAVSSGTNILYCYDLRDREWPDFGQMKNKNYGSFCEIESDKDYIYPGGTVQIYCLLNRNEVEPGKARLLHTTPSGTTYLILDGTEQAYTSDTWIYREEQIERDPSGQFIIPAFSLSLSEPGSHLFTLEVSYTDGTLDVDERIILVDTLDASAQYDISSICSGVATGLDFDIDGRLWVKDSAGVYSAIKMHNDRFIIDEDNKYAYFFEDYDRVKIE